MLCMSRGCDGAYGVVADPEYGTLVEYSTEYNDIRG